MKNKRSSLWWLIGKIGLIIGLLSAAAIVFVFWEDIRELFPWLPSLGKDCGSEPAEYDDFAD